MKKLFLLAAMASILTFSNLLAQTKSQVNNVRLGIGFNVAFPTGNTSNLYKTGFGGNLQFLTPIADNLHFILNGGYLNFTGKDINGLKVRNFGAIPLETGLRYFVGDFYLGGEIGAGIGTTRRSGTAFIYSPQLGVELPVSDNGSIDIGARFEGWSKGNKLIENLAMRNFFGLGIAYNLGF